MDKVVRERFKSLKREMRLNELALKLQRKEYKRRLEALNHEAERIKESQSMSISVEKFEGYANQWSQKFDTLQKEVKALSDKDKTDEGRGAWTGKYLPWGLTIILTIISILLAYFNN